MIGRKRIIHSPYVTAMATTEVYKSSPLSMRMASFGCRHEGAGWMATDDVHLYDNMSRFSLLVVVA